MQGLVVLACILLLAFLVYRSSHARPRCRSCGRVVVPGRSKCPWCHTPYRKTVTPPQESAVRLVCIHGPSKGCEYAIGGTNFTIGRSRDNNLAEQTESVSRQHALIASEAGQYVLYDRDSTNGTWVNGRRIAHHILQHGDQIQIGPSIFLFQAAQASLAPPGGLTPEPIRPATPAPPKRRHEFEDYRLVETIGGGGSSKVYRAVSERDGSTVAIKVLFQTDPYLVEKFEQAGRILSALQHPHIVRILAYGRNRGRYYIIMEYVEGGSLRDRLTPGRPLALDSAVSIVGQTCEALQYIHSQGVIHRDIKPENILFSSTGAVKVVDFGIAKWASAPKRTTDGMILGTPYYMSYEQAKGEQVHPQSDLYSLGIVLYEMLTGRVPFSGGALTVVHKHLTERPVAPRQLNPAIPGHLEKVILQAMSKDHRRRYSSAAEMASALGYSAGVLLPRRARTPSPVQRLRRRARPAPRLPGQGARLVILSSGHAIPLDADTRLGRNMINRSDGYISGQHARVFQQGQYFWLVDLDSQNGTFLNGQRIFEQVQLRNGDEIRLGHTSLRFEITR